MTQTENLVKQLPSDLDGLPAEPIERLDHELEPWEKRCHALAGVLDFHKIINTKEKRRGVEALGAEMVGKLTITSAGSWLSPTYSSRKESSRQRTSREKWASSRLADQRP